MKKFTIIILSVILAFCMLTACGGQENQAQEPASDGQNASENAEALPMVHAEIVIRDYGTVKLELDPNEAPLTVENFVNLASSGFYDGLKFHRIMDGFMIQGGANPDAKLQAIPGEFSSNGYENSISHTEGVISMARTNQPNSATSQFFITVADDTFLDGQYAAFGHVTEGLDICKKIASDAKPIDDNGTIPEDQQPVIETITITD
jgi:peptidyl-prolyl cis-trans isomerase B (cyclophilin B)